MWQMTQRPDVSDEDIGIRAVQIRKARAVEREIQRIRHGLGKEWSSFTEREIQELEWVLGEIWSWVPHTDWDEMHFGRLSSGEVVKLLGYGSELRRHSRATVDILNDATALVRAKE